MPKLALSLLLVGLSSAAVQAQPISCDLRECIQIALQSHPAGRTAQASVDHARAMRELRVAQSRPLLGVEATAGYFDGGRTSPFDLLARTEEDVRRRANGTYGQSMLHVDVPLFAEGAFVPTSSRAVRAADLGVAEQEGRADVGRLQIAQAVAQAYDRLARANAGGEVLAQVLRLRASNLALAREQFGANLSPRRDLLRAQAREAEARRDVALNALEQRHALMAMASAMGTSAQDLRVRDVPLAVPAPAASLDELIALGWRHSPEIKARESTLAKVEEEAARARASGAPEVGLRLAARRGDDFKERGVTQYEAFVQLRMPLVDFGRASAASAVSRADLSGAAARLDEARAQVALQVQELYQQIATLDQEVQLLQAKLDEASEDSRLAGALARENLASQAARNDAEATQLQLRKALADAQRSQSVARFRLNLLVGG